MQLGFVSAILPELSLEEVLSFAQAEGFDCVELMCWPPGKAERRYAGVTHIDATDLNEETLVYIQGLIQSTGVGISALGYYPNLLSPVVEEAEIALAHLKKVILAASVLGIGVVNTFAGRDWRRSIDENWSQFLEVWKPLIAFAEEKRVRIGIENCPMYFTQDEWPSGKNLAISPSVWRRMFAEIPNPSFGLNYDPSHLVWQQMDYLKPMTEFGSRLFHIHAKDVRIDRDRLDSVGILAPPLEYHCPKLPGLGEIDWGRFFSVLGDAGYEGAVCIEAEDRAYEKSLESRKAALRQSARYLRNYLENTTD
ncbi:MAG: sugar phosphate isomerase/epimerase [Armatimonadetes bacterium]|nr:sugar phosphate isomerase/epimerase [Armatimonadota bacterium]